MTPGTLFFDTRFVFRDGEEGQKILVALGTAHGVTIVVKSTSQGRRYSNDYGWQAGGRVCSRLNRPDNKARLTFVVTPISLPDGYPNG